MSRGGGARAPLVARPDGLPDRIGRDAHGTLAVARLIALAYVVITAVLIGFGLLVTHVMAHDGVGLSERRFAAWLASGGTTTWGDVSTAGTFMGDSITVSVIALVVTVLLLVRGWGRRSWLLAFGLLLELAAFLTANYTVRRPRPTIRHLGSTPSTFSFPSGHSAAAVVLYGGIAIIVTVATTRVWARCIAWFCAILLPLAVGSSRIYRGDHYLTDVLAGLLLGAAALSAAVFVEKVLVAKRGADSHPHEEAPTAQRRLEPSRAT